MISPAIKLDMYLFGIDKDYESSRDYSNHGQWHHIQEAYVLLSSIIEWVEINKDDSFSYLIQEEITKEEYENNIDNDLYWISNKKYIKASPTVELTLHQDYVLKYSHRFHEVHCISIKSTLEEFNDLRNKAIIDFELDKQRALNSLAFENKHILSDEGTWKEGTQYSQLNFVKHPTENKTFLCIKENKSSSVGVLNNSALWCEISLPSLEN